MLLPYRLPTKRGPPPTNSRSQVYVAHRLNEFRGVLISSFPSSETSTPFTFVGAAFELTISLSRNVYPAKICKDRVMLPVALNSIPCTRWSPSSVGGSPATRLGVRASVLSTRKTAPVTSKRSEKRSHLVPSSNVLVFYVSVLSSAGSLHITSR